MDEIVSSYPRRYTKFSPGRVKVVRVSSYVCIKRLKEGVHHKEKKAR